MDKLSFKLRFQKRQVGPTPVGLQGVQGLFASGPNRVRCQVGLASDFVHDAVQKALQEMQNLLQSQGKHYRDYWGPVGVSTHMQAIRRAMATAWDWECLLQKPPTKKHDQAFLKLVQLFKPALEKTEWPDPVQFPYVQRVWPEEDEWRFQYFALMHSVRDASNRLPYKEAWFPLEGYKAGPGRSEEKERLNSESPISILWQGLLTKPATFTVNLNPDECQLQARCCNWTPAQVRGVILDTVVAPALLPKFKVSAASKQAAEVLTHCVVCFLTGGQTFLVRPEMLRKVGFSSAARGMRRVQGSFAGAGKVAVISKMFPGTARVGAKSLGQKLVIIDTVCTSCMKSEGSIFPPLASFRISDC